MCSCYTHSNIVTVCQYCSGLDSDMPDILESDLEGRVDTNCCLEESWESQGIQFVLLNLLMICAWGGLYSRTLDKYDFGRIV